MAAATGSCEYAEHAARADYNGHHVGFVAPNAHKPYWTCYYTWAGINTIGRGSLDSCLAAAEREYDRGALGATAVVSVESPEDIAVVEARGRWQPHSKEIEAAHYASFKDPRFDRINDARADERYGLFPGAVGTLIHSATVEEYEAKRADYHAKEVERRARERKEQAEQEALARENEARELAETGKLKIDGVSYTLFGGSLHDGKLSQVGTLSARTTHGFTYTMAIECHNLKKFAARVERTGEIDPKLWEKK
jgi:hypothetical protein